MINRIKRVLEALTPIHGAHFAIDEDPHGLWVSEVLSDGPKLLMIRHVKGRDLVIVYSKRLNDEQLGWLLGDDYVFDHSQTICDVYRRK